MMFRAEIDAELQAKDSVEAEKALDFVIDEINNTYPWLNLTVAAIVPRRES